MSKPRHLVLCLVGLFTWWSRWPTVYFAQPIWFLLPLVCCFERFFSTNNMHETYLFFEKTFFEIKNTFVWNKKHGFQENKHYFFRKTTRFFFIFGLLPWKFIESLLQTFSQTFRGGCKFDWNFQCKLAGMGWKFHCKLSRLDCKFKETFRVALKVSLNLQSSLESLQWNFQPIPASLHWKFQSNLQPPLKVWLKVCNKLSINFQGSNPKIKKNLVVFLKK